MEKTLLLRITMAITLLAHSIPTILDNSIASFGNNYLSELGFGSSGIVVAWLIKISHIVAAILLVLNKYLKWAVFPTVFILLMGIILVHGKGWFVVGGGQNGMEFNVLMIVVLITIYMQSPRERR